MAKRKRTDGKSANDKPQPNGSSRAVPQPAMDKAAVRPSHDILGPIVKNAAHGTKPGPKILKTGNHIDVKTELPTIQIVTGSYERVLHGITASLTVADGNLSTMFTDSFLFNAHTSAIRCLALSPLPQDASEGVFLATGGSDERVNVFSLSAAPMPESDSKGRQVPSMPSLGPNKISENPMNRELGTLVQHSSSITALHFPSRSKLLSGSEDNTISVTRLRDLGVVSTVKAPRPKVSGQASGDSAAAGTTPAGINDFAIHPSMKLMVSVGRGEKSMRLWNLVTGKKAGVLNFDREVLQAVKESKYSHGEGRKIRWNADGTEFAIAFERGVAVFGQDSKPRCVLMPTRLTKVHELQYFLVKTGTEVLAVSTEDGKILFFDTTRADVQKSDLPVLSPVSYVGGEKHNVSSRIKDFQILTLANHGHPGHLVVVGCSNGDVRIIMVDDEELLKPKTEEGLVGNSSTNAYSTGGRITCLAAFVMLPPHDIEGGLSEAESVLASDDDDSEEDL